MTACRVRLKVRVSLSIISAEGGEENVRRGVRKRLQLCLAAVCRVLTGVLAGAVHGRHPGALLTGGRLLQGQVDDVDQSKLLVVPQHVGIDVVVDTHVLCKQDKDTFNICQAGSENGPNRMEMLPELATVSLENRGFWSVL